MEWSETDILGSAYKHGIEEADIRHALRNIVRYREIEADGELRMLIIAPIDREATSRLSQCRRENRNV